MSLELTLCQRDKQHIQKFLNCLNCNIPLKERNIVLNGQRYKSYRVVINCTNMCKDLCNLGCVPNKTYSLNFPPSNLFCKDFIKDFIRGYFDGDGCISVNSKTNRIELNVTGSIGMLSGISSELIQLKLLHKAPKIYHTNKTIGMIYIYGRETIKQVLDYLYLNASIYLDRKYHTYISFKSQCKNSILKRGVYLDKRSNKYVATITINKRRYHLGSFSNVEDAISVRIKAEDYKRNYLSIAR